jgi:hypothetical protein
VPNPQSTAQVVVALSALGIDCEQDQRFIKNGNTLFDGIEKYRTADRRFSAKEGGEFNYTATVQSFYAAVAYLRMCEGRAPLYVLDNCDAEHLETDITTETNAPSENDSTNATDTTDRTDAVAKKGFPTYKLICLLVIAIVALAVCVLLLALGKRNIKNFIALLLAAAICARFQL